MRNGQLLFLAKAWVSPLPRCPSYSIALPTQERTDDRSNLHRPERELISTSCLIAGMAAHPSPCLRPGRENHGSHQLRSSSVPCVVHLTGGHCIPTAYSKLRLAVGRRLDQMASFASHQAHAPHFRKGRVLPIAKLFGMVKVTL
jgi:hypothetical protein